ncbi:hypothetical protein DFH09DRAFT_1093699 [Mycena vulgaris]|nr:hypothetical protein DFH09DRAFT_1093699 [Mycena vulgaris]
MHILATTLCKGSLTALTEVLWFKIGLNCTVLSRDLTLAMKTANTSLWRPARAAAPLAPDSDISGELAANKETLKTLADGVNALAYSVKALAGSVNSLGNAVESLRQDIRDLDAKIDRNEGMMIRIHNANVSPKFCFIQWAFTSLVIRLRRGCERELNKNKIWWGWARERMQQRRRLRDGDKMDNEELGEGRRTWSTTKDTRGNSKHRARIQEDDTAIIAESAASDDARVVGGRESATCLFDFFPGLLRNLMVTDDGWLSPMTGIFPIHFSVPIPSQSLSRAQHALVKATNITWNLRYRVTYFNYAGSIGHTINFPESSAKATQTESCQTACRSVPKRACLIERTIRTKYCDGMVTGDHPKSLVIIGDFSSFSWLKLGSNHFVRIGPSYLRSMKILQFCRADLRFNGPKMVKRKYYHETAMDMSGRAVEHIAHLHEVFGCSGLSSEAQIKGHQQIAGSEHNESSATVKDLKGFQRNESIGLTGVN